MNCNAFTGARWRVISLVVMAAIALGALVSLARADTAESIYVEQSRQTASLAPRPDMIRAHVRGNASRLHQNWNVEGGVQAMIASTVTARLGAEWVQTALHIAKIESGFRCNARNRSAVGVFQTTNPAMFGISRAHALTCAGGVSAGISHMQMCIGKGARNAAQMMRCHNSGSPFGRVDPVYRRVLANR